MSEQGEPLLRLLAAVAAQSVPLGPDAAAAALADAVESWLVPVLGVELEWRLTPLLRSDDPGRAARPAAADWQQVVRELRTGFGGGLESLALQGDVPGAPAFPPDPRRSPVHARATLGSASTVAVSVQQWALRDGAAQPAVTQPAARWLLATATTAHADSGYVALDRADAWDPGSSWELATAVPPSARDFTSSVWGYGWGTLLSGRLVDAVGGLTALESLGATEVLRGPGGLAWIRLSDDVREVPDDRLRSLRERLAPVLPRGSRALAEHLAPAPDPYAAPPVVYRL
ncbi:hypothetical protein CLV35_2448 [Motilibacter peucedani]|uniref:Uncharacterized protein n=1 Tax=Motilibacter peucedani TaxID=598650 RepID=A0A420XP55_9ACTN|nr:hypothetical protein [Motilibacter peucedani]RKS73952.1 hypothetical protein CLV35_2448 [Motilibacter peucedani]